MFCERTAANTCPNFEVGCLKKMKKVSYADTYVVYVDPKGCTTSGRVDQQLLMEVWQPLYPYFEGLIWYRNTRRACYVSEKAYKCSSEPFHLG